MSSQNTRTQYTWKQKFLISVIVLMGMLVLSRYLLLGDMMLFNTLKHASPTSMGVIPVLTSTSSRNTVVAFGDSVTAGYGIDLSAAYPALLEKLLRAAGKSVTVINAGVSGETTAGGLRRADFIAEKKPDIVIIALGGNDVLRGIPPSNTKSNLASIIAKFQERDIRVVLAGMYAPDNLGETYVQEFNAIYPALAKEYNVPLVPFLLAGVALEPTLNQNDGIHPNEAGAYVIAKENILHIILPLLVGS